MVQDLIRYDILAQEALRGVIRKVLAEVAATGLPGNHHFSSRSLQERLVCGFHRASRKNILSR